MTNKDILYAIGAADDSFLIDAKTTLFRENKHKKTRKIRKVFLLAAILINLFGAIAYANGWFGLRQRVTPAEWPYENPPYGISETEISDGTADIIAFNGYQNSPEALAAAEWADIQASALTSETEYDSEWPENFGENSDVAGIYGVLDQNMLSKLFAIRDQYQLKLHETMIHPRTKDLFYKSLGLQPFLNEQKVEIDWSVKYLFEDGSFRVEGNALLNGREIPFGFSRNHNGVLALGYFYIWGIDDYEEWQIFVDDTAVNLALQQSENASKGFTFAELDDWFFTLDCGISNGVPVTREELELLASLFDYDQLTQGNTNLSVLDTRQLAVKPKTGLLSIAEWVQTPEYLAGSTFQHMYNDYVDASPHFDGYVSGQYVHFHYAPFPTGIESLDQLLDELERQYNLAMPGSARAIMYGKWVDPSIILSTNSFRIMPEGQPASEEDMWELLESESFLINGELDAAIHWDNGVWQVAVRAEGLSFDMVYIPKGSFCPIVREQLHPDATSWAYDGACGEQVCITLDGEMIYPRFQNPIVLYETDNAYVILQILATKDASALQACADCIDFTKLK